MIRKIIGVSCIFLLFFSSLSYAGGAVAKRQETQKKMMQKQRQLSQQREMMQQKMKEQQSSNQKRKPVEVEEVIDMEQLLASLDENSKAWKLMIDNEAKIAVVMIYIQKLKEQGAVIRKPPMLYVTAIDSMSKDSPQMLDQPFINVLRVLAIIEYDFDNGHNKDALALKILGSQEAVNQNKARLGIK